MKPIRQFLAAPFYVAAFLVLCVAIAVDLVGCAVTFLGAMVGGEE